MVRRIKCLLVISCLALSLTPARAADDYNALVRQYAVVRAEAGRGKGKSNTVAKKAAPIVKKIAALRTERGRVFLAKELERPPTAFGKECARALAGSGDTRAVALLLENFGRRRPNVARAIIDALEWAVKQTPRYCAGVQLVETFS